MHDPAVARAAIEELRKELRGCTGGKVIGPPPEPVAEDATAARLPGAANASTEELPAEPLAGGADAGAAMMCPNCGHKMVPEGGGGEETPAPGQLGGSKGKEALLLIPEKKK